MKRILNEKELSRTLRRITHEMIEKNNGANHLVFAGVQTRGVPIAERIIQNIESMEDIDLDLIPLDITEFRDDRDLEDERVVFRKKSKEFSVDNKSVIIVDDVIYTGRTARAAMEAILSLGRPSQIQLCVLVDRGHRELPIKADYVGKNIPSSHSEKVKVHLKEIDGEDNVTIE